VARIIYIDIFTSPPLFHRGSKSAKFCPIFRPHLHSECSDLKIGQKSKAIMYSTDVWALICCRPCAARAPQLMRSICQIGASKLRQLEEWLHCSISTVHGQIAFRFHKMVLCGGRKAAELSNSRWQTMPKFLIYRPSYLWNG